MCGIDSIIHLACIAHQTAYWCGEGILQKLGIDDLSVSELRRYVQENILYWSTALTLSEFGLYWNYEKANL